MKKNRAYFTVKNLLLLKLSFVLAACGSTVKLQNKDKAMKNESSEYSERYDNDNPAIGTSRPNESIQTRPLEMTRMPDEATIYFDFDSYTVDYYQKDIVEYARYLKENPNKKVVLHGHTDERGTPEYNLALGQNRAEAVKRALMSHGVPESAVEAVSFGEEKPRAVGHDEASWRINRRVDIVMQ